MNYILSIQKTDGSFDNNIIKSNLKLLMTIGREFLRSPFNRNAIIYDVNDNFICKIEK